MLGSPQEIISVIEKSLSKVSGRIRYHHDPPADLIVCKPLSHGIKYLIEHLSPLLCHIRAPFLPSYPPFSPQYGIQMLGSFISHILKHDEVEAKKKINLAHSVPVLMVHELSKTSHQNVDALMVIS